MRHCGSGLLSASPLRNTGDFHAARCRLRARQAYHVLLARLTDENGVSHQNRCELSAFKLQSISEGAAPSWIDKQNTPGATVLVVVQPVGWVGEWHENPKPQWIVPLSGRWFVETMDGKRVEMGPGEVSFGGDQNTKPDAQGRKGHRSGTVGNQPSVNLIVQLEKDPAAGQPCGFK